MGFTREDINVSTIYVGKIGFSKHNSVGTKTF